MVVWLHRPIKMRIIAIMREWVPQVKHAAKLVTLFAEVLVLVLVLMMPPVVVDVRAAEPPHNSVSAATLHAAHQADQSG